MGMSNRREFARQLRYNLTDTERFVWSRLRSRRFAGFKFRRQFPLGQYVVDFVCLAARVIIELDGGQHTLQREYDSERTRWLENDGYCVIRFWNHQIPDEWDQIEDCLWDKLEQGNNSTAVRSPSPGLRPPSPTRGEGNQSNSDKP